MTKNEYITQAIRDGMDMDQALAAWKEEMPLWKNDLAMLVRMFRTYEGTKKEVVAKAAAASGYSLATTNHFYNALAFAKEYHRQETE